MKFRFCGDLDCPDWVLAEINILARLTSVKMKLLVVQVIKALLGEEIDMKKVEKITADAKYEQGDVKASIAGIRFIISSAAKNDVDEETLASELQQLGLPKEHATALCKTYENKLVTLRQEFRRQSFRRSSKLSNVTWKIVDSGNRKEERTVRINMELKANSGSMETKTFEITQEKLCLLLNELKLARSQMKVLESS